MPDKPKFTKHSIEDFCAALKIDKEKDIFIVDPFMIHLPDLKAVGIKNIIRVRRDGWGKGNIHLCFKQIPYKEYKDSLFIVHEGD
jgi:hypothetical protein